MRAIGYEIRCLNNLIRRTVKNSPAVIQADQISGANTGIIMYLRENEGRDVFQRDIEEHFSITRSTSSKVISLMEKKGLIRRTAVAHDARLKKLELTGRSREISRLMIQDAEQFERALTKGFSGEELEKLRDYLGRMTDNVNEYGSLEIT